MSRDLADHAAYCRRMAARCARDLDRAANAGTVLDLAVDRLEREHALWTQLAAETDAYLADQAKDTPTALF